MLSRTQISVIKVLLESPACRKIPLEALSNYLQSNLCNSLEHFINHNFNCRWNEWTFLHAFRSSTVKLSRWCIFRCFHARDYLYLYRYICNDTFAVLSGATHRFLSLSFSLTRRKLWQTLFPGLRCSSTDTRGRSCRIADRNPKPPRVARRPRRESDTYRFYECMSGYTDSRLYVPIRI